MASALLAHEGGWDELLMVGVPVVLFAVLLRAANRRAHRIGPPEEHPEPPEL